MSGKRMRSQHRVYSHEISSVVLAGGSFIAKYLPEMQRLLSLRVGVDSSSFEMGARLLWEEGKCVDR
jgi:hypothetical protein